MLNNVQHIMTGKRKPPIGFRLYDDEEERLNALLAEVRQRNRSMDRSKLLREAIGFDPRSNLTDADLSYLRTGKRESKQPVLVISPHDIGAIADATGIDDYTIMRYLNNDLAGIAPQDIQRIQNAMREPATDKVVPLGDKLANGKR